MSSPNSFYAPAPQLSGAHATAAFSAYGFSAPPQGAGYQPPLSLGETVSLHLEYAFQGLWDALNFEPALRLTMEDPEIQAHVLRSAILNSLSIASVGAFNWFILPLLDPKNNKWFHRHFEALYQATWLAPLVALSLYLNLHWCSLIANRTFSLKHGRKAVSASPYSGMVAHIASSAYRVILIASYLTLTFVLTYVPYFGAFLSFVYICWVNSYYCFEFFWISRGMTLSQRVKHEEERWAYYLAFGFPSAIACMWGSSLANAAVFALFFPYFIVQAMHATPVPSNPSSPTSSANGNQSPSQEGGSGGLPVSPHHLVPIRLRFFAPVIIVNDALVRLLSVTGTSRATKRSLGLQTFASAGDGEIIGGGGGGATAGGQSFDHAVAAGLSPIGGAYGYASPVSPAGGSTNGSGATYRVRRRKGD